ncbi:MAG TPA: amidohydrolase family protein [Pirellulaceae bacterium]|nr:amidohydrolase family protein [Pirellulaceae bacterium]
MLLSARRYDTLRPVALTVERGRIGRIEPAAHASPPHPPPLSHEGRGEMNAAAADAALPLVAPGLVDLQINGYAGIEFNDPQLTIEKVRQVALSQDRFGVTAFLATCTTDALDVLALSFATIARAIRELPEVAARIPGIHCEGPFISPEDGPRGAHPQQHVRPPNWDEFRRLQDAAEGKIKLLTISPEYDSSADVIRRAADSGVLVAIGHTQATSDQIKAAVDAGARMSTHLGNGAHPQIKRHPNYIWDQLADDRLVASLIVDGHHLPPAVVKSMVRAKTPERIVLVSDITSMGGMSPGKYQTGLGELEVLPSGKLVPAGSPDILAGASLPIDLCVANVMRFAGVDLAAAIDMASTRPAELIGLPNHALEAGSPADLVLFDLPQAAGQPLHVRATYHGGERTFAA